MKEEGNQSENSDKKAPYSISEEQKPKDADNPTEKESPASGLIANWTKNRLDLSKVASSRQSVRSEISKIIIG